MLDVSEFSRLQTSLMAWSYCNTAFSSH